MFVEHQDQIIALAERLGLPWTCLGDRGGKTARDVINGTPAFFIEREIALKLEGQARAIEVNDMRDMQSFRATLPYADLVIAEKQFTSLAKQAGLDRVFDTQITTDIFRLWEYL